MRRDNKESVLVFLGLPQSASDISGLTEREAKEWRRIKKARDLVREKRECWKNLNLKIEKADAAAAATEIDAARKAENWLPEEDYSDNDS